MTAVPRPPAARPPTARADTPAPRAGQRLDRVRRLVSRVAAAVRAAHAAGVPF